VRFKVVSLGLGIGFSFLNRFCLGFRRFLAFKGNLSPVITLLLCKGFLFLGFGDLLLEAG
jgi:hypothetical protein